MDPVQVQLNNARARARVINEALPMRQALQSQQAATANLLTGPVTLNFTPRNVGLIKGFLLKLSTTINNANMAGDATRTEYGAFNLARRIQFTDLNNSVRINTTGWHLGTLNATRLGYLYFTAYTVASIYAGWGSNWTVQSAPATIVGNTTATVQVYIYVPIAYSADDTTGAILAQVTNANMSLQVTVPSAAQAFIASATADHMNAIYYGATPVLTFATAVTCVVYQDYWDQLPQQILQNGQRVWDMPSIDVNTGYYLLDSYPAAPVANQDNYIPYNNYRQYLSTMLIYNNNVMTGVGADINSFSLKAANTTNIWQIDPQTAAGETRLQIMTDLPTASYWFSHMAPRQKPIDTNVYGNIALVFNPATVVNTNYAAYIAMGYESFGDINYVPQGGSMLVG